MGLGYRAVVLGWGTGLWYGAGVLGCDTGLIPL